MAGARPFGVTLVGVIIVIEGILGLVAAVFALLNFKDNVGLFSAIILGAISLVYLLVAKGLFNGNSGSRLIVGIVTVIALLHGFWQLLFTPDWRLQGGLEVIVALIVLFLLYNARAKAFFNG